MMIEDKDSYDNCGVFGIYSSEANCVYDIYNGVDFLQHRGQQYCGISTVSEGTIHLITHWGKVDSRFMTNELDSLKGNLGIGHVSLTDRQPIKLVGKIGEFTAAFSGNIINAEDLFARMRKKGHSFSADSQIELIAKIIAEGKNIVEGIVKMAKKIIGSYALVILTKDGIYAARDIYGFRPLILGKGEGKFAVASESRAIVNLDLGIYRDVKPGEILFINKDGFKTLRSIRSPRRAYCAFEWAYIASIDSLIDGVYVKEARNNLGEQLALRDLREGGVNVDVVAPVPMSGIGHALGYHRQSGIQYQEVFLYNRYADRSYTQETQTAREKMAKRKLSVLKEAVMGKRIVLCDDSIVRGTQIRDKVRELKKAGAREVHVRVACPPLMHPCIFGISTRTYDELAARRFIKNGEIDSLEKLKQVEKHVAKYIDADSVKYNTLENFVKALRLPKDALCLRCWDGVSAEPRVRNEK